MQLPCPQCNHPNDLPEAPTSPHVACSACGASFQLAPGPTVDWSPAEVLKKLGKFQLLEVLGQGAFGCVYKARDLELERLVAIKVPRDNRLARPGDGDRFLREARSVARLRHPGIVPVYEVGAAGETPYLVSEFVPGLTLEDYLTARRFAARPAAELVALLADALDYAHGQGVVHRDVKPANVLLRAEGPGREAGRRGEAGALQPLLTDFGLAKRDAEDVTMTLDGQVLGTPAYMSPEQAAGEAHRVDGRSDVYSLGVILYRLLTGELPFRGNIRMMVHQLLHEDPQPPRKLNNHVPRDLEAVCLKAMSKEPAQRYPSAGALAEDLRRFLAGEPVRARRSGLLGRLGRWARRPERVRDAGIVMVVQAVILALGACALPLILRLSDEVSLVPAVAGWLVVCALCVVVGLKTQARRLWALWVGLAYALVLASLLVAFLVVSIIRARQSCAGAFALLVIILLGGIFAPFLLLTLLFIYACALLAYYANRNVMRWWRAGPPPSEPGS